MGKFLGVFKLFSCFAEAFVCTFLTSSTNRVRRMHSLGSSRKKSFSNKYFLLFSSWITLIFFLSPLSTFLHSQMLQDCTAFLVGCGHV